ncbi:MAG: T9SS type A sorting domain-containing protein, partial [bacterium]|nr:T9SS type A sorting domain-containing protein [bacterium]
SYRTSAPPIVPAEFIPPSTTIAKFWNIETTGGDGFDATLDLYFTEDDLPAGLIPPPPTLNAGSYHPVTGAVEHVYNAEVTLIQAGSPNLYRARVLHVTGFSLWALGSGSMLPVELSSLSAYWEMGRVLIQWRTESEHSNREFRLDRKTTGVDYFPIAVLPSRAANGNSSTPLSYQFTDAAASLSDGLMYRLSQIDQDGDARVLREFSAIDQTPQTIKGFALLHSYPNPFNGQFTIRYQLAKADIVRIGLYNIQGALVKEIYTGMTTNRLTSISVNADKLPTGLYVLKLASRGFSTQRKVLLVR